MRKITIINTSIFSPESRLSTPMVYGQQSDYGDYGEQSEGIAGMDILELIQGETNIAFRKNGTAGKEHHGACPWCGDDGKGSKADRFIIWPGEGRYLCRRCGRKGDDIQFIREYKHMEYREACEYLDYGDKTIHHNHHNHHNDFNHPINHNHEQPLQPPSELWLSQAQPFLLSCQERLWSDAGARALTWLQGRGLTDATIRTAGLGYCDRDHYADRPSWGLAPEYKADGKPKGLWLPRGVVIPWMVDGALWGVRIRRPQGDPKYYFIPGGQPGGLYNADGVTPGQPATILEGELDALTICQAGYTAVATGSTHGARRTRWVARLSTADPVLVAYDNDDAGDDAAAYWPEVLPNAKRWRPYWSDANQMQQDGASVGAWIAAGLGVAAEIAVEVVEQSPAAIILPPMQVETTKAPLPVALWLSGLPPAVALAAYATLRSDYYCSCGADGAGWFVRCDPQKYVVLNHG